MQLLNLQLMTIPAMKKNLLSQSCFPWNYNYSHIESTDKAYKLQKLAAKSRQHSWANILCRKGNDCHTWQFCKGVCTPKQGFWLCTIGKGNPILSLKSYFLNPEFQFLPPVTRSSYCFVFFSVPFLTLSSHPKASHCFNSPFSSTVQPTRHQGFILII